MSKTLAYRNRAAQFRELASRVPSQGARESLLNMAATWDALADDRERLLGESEGLPSDRSADHDRSSAAEVAESLKEASGTAKAPETLENETAPKGPEHPYSED